MDGTDPEQDPGQVTRLLGLVRDGQPESAEQLLPLVYAQLRVAAGRLFEGERAGHTLQPTALVHEAYVKLVQGSANEWDGREHFCAVAARAMRQILCDHARARNAAKRSAVGDREPLANIETPSNATPMDVLMLDELLTRLATGDPKAATVVDLKFFGGLTHGEIATVTGDSVHTIDRAWRRAHAWMKMKLAEDPE